MRCWRRDPPTADPDDSEINPTKERHRHLERAFQAVAREQLVSGCHVHVGITDRDLAIDVLDRVGPWLPTVVALAANSPFWAGDDTGYASFRTEVWSWWPLTGMPARLGSRAEFDELTAALEATEALPDPTFLYWDVRPSARYETRRRHGRRPTPAEGNGATRQRAARAGADGFEGLLERVRA